MPNSSSDDPTSEWPEDIKKAYENLKIPSLYDAVLANERLSLEIRRQDRELKSIVETMQALSEKFNHLTQLIEEGWEQEYLENEGDLKQLQNFYENLGQHGMSDLEIELIQGDQWHREKQMTEILFETYEHIRNLSQTSKKMLHQLSILLTKEDVNTSFSHSPKIIEEMVHTLVEAIEKTRFQLISHLEEIFISIIDPHQGDLFDPSKHHILEYTKGGKEGTIAQVVYVGFQQNQTILRVAEVIVYSG